MILLILKYLKEFNEYIPLLKRELGYLELELTLIKVKAIALEEGENMEDKTISGENGGGEIRRVCWPGAKRRPQRKKWSDVREESEKERSEK